MSNGAALLDAPQAVFEALVDPHRRRILQRLVEGERLSITQISEDLPISRQAVTKHLDLLAGAGLVAAERRGRERVLTFVPEPLTAAAQWISALEAQWDRRLAALQAYLAEDVAAEARREASEPES